jgi:hypothetical protein
MQKRIVVGYYIVLFQHGHDITEEVSCRLPTSPARVRSQVRLCEICGGRSDSGAGFLPVLRFPLPVLIPPTPYSSSASSSSSSGTGTISPVVAGILSGLNLIPRIK